MADTYPKNTIDDNGLKKVWDMVMGRLGLKVDKEAGKGLSTNDYTTAEKNKLSGIESGAEVNTVTSVAGKTGDVTIDKSDVGLPNVGNFKAVSTSANQGLTNTEKSNARANIDTPSNGDIQSSKTLKSSVVTVNDAAPINAEDITVDITPVQDLHGYDRPWAGGAGKNKLNYIDFKGVQGGTVTKSNGTLTITGTNARTGANITDKLVNNLPAGTYTLSFTVTSITNYQNQPTFFGFIVKKSGGAYAYPSVSVSQTGTKSLTYTLSEGDRFERIDFNINDQSSALSNACTFEIKDIQVEEGSTPTSYAPYSNECPIEGRTGAELDRVGKNWFDGTFPDIAPQIVTYRSIAVPNGTYTVSSSCPLNSGQGANIFFLAGNVQTGASTNRNGVWVGQNRTVTTTNGYVTIAYRLDGGIDPRNYSTQIELGTTATAYEPYQGRQYTANFGETVHGGKWHVTKGGTTVDKGYLTENSIKGVSGTSAGGLHWYDMPLYSIYNANALISNMLVEMSSDDAWRSSNACMSVNSNGKIRLYFKSSTIADAKTELNGLQIVYELATPTTISTPKQNVPMLQGINTVSADCGDTSLKYQPDNVIGELKGEIEDVIDYAEPKFVNYSSYPHDTAPETAFGVNVRLRRDRGYVSIENVALTFWQNYPIADFYYEIQNPVPTEFIPEYDVEKLFLHINGQSFLNVILTNTGILKLRMYSPVRIVDNYPNVFWLQTSDETGCGKAKY